VEEEPAQGSGVNDRIGLQKRLPGEEDGGSAPFCRSALMRRGAPRCAASPLLNPAKPGSTPASRRACLKVRPRGWTAQRARSDHGRGGPCASRAPGERERLPPPPSLLLPLPVALPYPLTLLLFVARPCTPCPAVLPLGVHGGPDRNTSRHASCGWRRGRAPPPPPSRRKVDTSRPSLRTNWTHHGAGHTPSVEGVATPPRAHTRRAQRLRS